MNCKLESEKTFVARPVSRGSQLALWMVLGLSVTGQTATAERSKAPIEYASLGGANAAVLSANVSKNAVGPVDLRPGAVRQTGKIVQLPVASSRPAATVSANSGWAEPYAGPPYQVKGKWFVPMHEPDYDEVGIASWYGPGFHGHKTSTGEVYDQHAFTAAHPTLPVPSTVRVTNLENGKSVLVRLNDRGPYIDDRIIDLSKAAADALGTTQAGTGKVRVQYVGPAPAEANAVADERLARAVGGRSAPAATPQRVAQVSYSAMKPLENMPLPASQAPAPEARSSVEVSTGYAVQAGSFSDLKNAQDMQAKLSAFGPVYLSSAVVNGSQFYRVNIGPWASASDAKSKQEELARAGTKSIVVEKK